MFNNVKTGLAVAGIAILMVACGGESSDVASSTTSVPGDATSTTERPATSTTKPPVTSPPATDPPPAPEGPTAGNSCEDSLERVSGLGALGADCQTAREVAAAYDAEVMGAGSFPDDGTVAVAGGWSCRSAPSMDSEETFEVLCDKGDPRIEAVTFSWGV